MHRPPLGGYGGGMTNRDTKKLIAITEAMKITFGAAAEAMYELVRTYRPETIEAESWPVYNDGDYIMCGNDDCPCDMEGSVILIPFKDLTYPPFPPYTARQLLDAIEQHIVNMKEEEED